MFDLFNTKKIAKLELIIKTQEAVMEHMKGTILKLCSEYKITQRDAKKGIVQGLPKVSIGNMDVERPRRLLARPWGLIDTHLDECIHNSHMHAMYDAYTLAKIVTKLNPTYEDATASQIYQSKGWQRVMAMRKSIKAQRTAKDILALGSKA